MSISIKTAFVTAALAAATPLALQPSWVPDAASSASFQLAAALTIAVLVASVSVSYFYQKVLGFENLRHKTYDNGVSALFAFRLAVLGPGFQSLMKVTATTTRRRLYSGMRRFVFFGREIWTAGHPALCKHIFSPANGKLWHKVDKPTLNGMFFQEDVPNNAMLYTGDSEGWKHAREAWSPFFLQTDFSCYDEQIDEIVEKHLHRLLKYRQGRAELLELMLYVTVDLLCQVLYGACLPQGELTILVEALAEFTVPATSHRGTYPGGIDCYSYHCKVAREISDKAPNGVFVKIIMKDEHMSQTNRYENCAFFLEALTPAFASFWTLSNVMLKSTVDKNIKQKCLEDPVHREKCIKESLRMYPPVPALWGRIANKTHTFTNPLFDDNIRDNRSVLAKLFSSPDIRTIESITIKKDTMVFCIPSCLHYDDRIWLNPEEFLPSRWDKDPSIIKENTTTARKARNTVWGALALGKEDSIRGRLAEEKRTLKMKGSSYDSRDVPIRYKLFGPEVEQEVEIENYEQLKVVSENEEYMAWSFFPFGLGKHMCLGRRLAVKIVDGIVANLLSYDINFANGNTPNLFKQHWTDRLNSVSAVYNYPADAVYVEFGGMAGDIKRIDSMFTREARKARKTAFSRPMDMPIITEQSSPVRTEKSALLLITCQNEFLDAKGKLYTNVKDVMGQLGTRKHLKELTDAAIDGDALIIHAPVDIKTGDKYKTTGFDEFNLSSLDGMFVPGSWNSELFKDTPASADDIILASREGTDCVNGTRLLSSLKDNQITRLFVAGLLTDMTVENTVVELSKKLKGHVTLHPVSDATATYTMEAQNATFKTVLPRVSTPVTTDVAVDMLAS